MRSDNCATNMEIMGTPLYFFEHLNIVITYLVPSTQCTWYQIRNDYVYCTHTEHKDTGRRIANYP